jgi:Polyketide cyclase / dehydrase and lipid transport
MPYASCPTAIVNAPAELVWALLMAPAGWGGVFDLRVASVDPPGPAVAGQRVRGETGPEIFHLKLTFRTVEIDPDQYRLRLDVNLPFGLAVREEIRCTPLDDAHCRVNYHCNFDFPGGWRGTLMRLLLNRRLDSGPENSLFRLKRAAERCYVAKTALPQAPDERC